jgi:hypothetical protein
MWAFTANATQPLRIVTGKMPEARILSRVDPFATY